MTSPTKEQAHTATPGPWIVDARYPNCVRAANGTVIANTDNADQYANARAISAMPELMDACASLWAAFSDTDDPVLRRIAMEARAAIERATGAAR